MIIYPLLFFTKMAAFGIYRKLTEAIGKYAIKLQQYFFISMAF